MNSFKAFRIHLEDKKITAGFENVEINELTSGEVIVKVAWSGINYKDALAATGKGRILRQYPLVGGIDLSGRVVSSESSEFVTGDSVLVCGAGLSETLDGGYTEYARVPVSALVKIPDGLTEFEVMGLGTAGFTAAIAVDRMQENHQSPDDGPIVVTGATGGVGCFAIDMLSKLGYEVMALTGKSDQAEFLKSIGTGALINRHELDMGTKPLERATWGGAVDNVGGETLAWLTRTVKPLGNIASIGLAGGFELNTTVMPFILRGVSLLGINSVEIPSSYRQKIWQRIASDLKPAHMDRIVRRTIDFDELPGVFDDYVRAQVVGRTVVKIGG